MAGLCGAALLCVPVIAASVPQKEKNADRQFIERAAVLQMTLAHLGKMAQDQGNKTEVKDLGSKMVQDQTNAYSELCDLAGKQGETVPKGINIRKEPGIERLVSLKGAGFDRQFPREEIVQVERAVALFKRESEHGQNADVKAYAGKVLPQLQDELQKAKDLTKTGKRS